MKRTLFLFLCIITSVNIFSQSEYLDKSYGDNGTVSFEIDNLLSVSINHLSADSKGNLYIAVYHGDSLGNREYCMYKFKPNGNQDTNFGEQGILCTTDTLSNQISIWSKQENDFILEHHFNNDSLIRVYDTEANLLQEFRPELTSGFAQAVSITNNQKVLLHNFCELHRYNSNGSLDSTFGNNGIVDANELTNDSLSFYFFNSLDNGNIYLSSFVATDSIESKILKLHPDGSLDETFNYSGILYEDYFYYNYNFIQAKNDKILAQGISIDTSCEYPLQYKTRRLNKNGTLDNNFGENGILQGEDDCSESFSYLILNSTFSDDKILNMKWNYEYIGDSLAYYNNSLVLFSESGNLIPDFGIEGELVLDFLPNGFAQIGTIDKNNNVYLASISDSGTEILISKLAGNNFVEQQTGNLINNGFTILNNPSNGDFVLDYQGENRENITIKLYDLHGRLVHSAKYDNIQFGNQFYFDQFNLAPATYILKASSNNEATLFSGKVLVIE